MKESILCKVVIIIDGCLCIPSRQPVSAPDRKSRGIFLFKGSVKNNLVEFAPKFAVDLIDLIGV